jgi:hypothetical protein
MLQAHVGKNQMHLTDKMHLIEKEIKSMVIWVLSELAKEP